MPIALESAAGVRRMLGIKRTSVSCFAIRTASSHTRNYWQVVVIPNHGNAVCGLKSPVFSCPVSLELDSENHRNFVAPSGKYGRGIAAIIDSVLSQPMLLASVVWPFWTGIDTGSLRKEWDLDIIAKSNQNRILVAVTAHEDFTAEYTDPPLPPR